MARVLVTGASGFIGEQLVAALSARGDQVRCLVRPTSRADRLQKSEVELATGDVTQPERLPAAVADVDVVYHLAGLTKAHNLAGFCRVNEAGVRNVLAACAERTSPPAVVVVSSLAAAGAVIDPQRLRIETDLPQPASNYGRSKRAGELAAETYADRVPITVVRPPIVLGPGDVAGLALFRTIRRMRSFVVLGAGRHFSVVHVADLIGGMIAAAERGERLPPRARDGNTAAVAKSLAGDNVNGTGYYFIAGDEHPKFAEIGRMIARSVGRPGAWVIRFPRGIVWVAGAAGEVIGRVTFRPRYLSLDKARDIWAGHWVCSPEKARRQLRFSPAASLAQRIEETAAWYRASGWL